MACASIVAGCGASDSDTESSNDQPAWTKVTLLPTPRSEIAVALLEHRAYVAGGYSGPNVFEVYDMELDVWSTLADLPVGVDHATLVAHGGLIYLAGGDTDLLFAYDPKTDVWAPRANSPYSRYASAGVVIDDSIHLVGGIGPAAETLLRYDVADDSWTTLSPLSERRDHVGAVALDDRIHALSGRRADSTNLRSTEIHDPGTNAWSAGALLQEGRSGFGYALLDGKIYVAGGELIAEPVHAQDSAEVYDPASDAWSEIPALPTPVHGCGMLAWDGRLWLFGGSDTAYSATPNDGAVYVYRP
jgi:hypothetical protein